jgi:photosystem II stability/assembly factor-like uncharacterized protein
MILQTDTQLYGENIDDLKAKTQTDFIYSSRITKITNNSQPLFSASVNCFDFHLNKSIELFKVSYNLYQPEFNAIEYLDSNNIIAASKGYIVYKTKNRGLNLDTIKIKNGNLYADPFCMSFSDTLNGVLSYYLTDYVFITKDGGYNWDTLPNSREFIHYLKIFDTNTIYFMEKGEDDGQYLRRTFNRGITWDTLLLPQNTNSLYFLNKDTAYITANANYYSTPYKVHLVYRTHDGGKNWELIREYTNGNLQIKDVYFNDYINGLILDASNFIYRTSDAGKTWNWEKPDTSKHSFGGQPIFKIIYPQVNGGLFFLKNRIFAYDIISGIESLENSYQELIYPNPATEHIRINNYEEFNSYKIYNYLGNICLDGLANSDYIDVSKLANGCYYLFLYNKDTFKRTSFIKN